MFILNFDSIMTPFYISSLNPVLIPRAYSFKLVPSAVPTSKNRKRGIWPWDRGCVFLHILAFGYHAGKDHRSRGLI